LGLAQPTSITRTSIFLLALFFATTAGWAVMKSIPDLSGRWKLDVERSSGRSLRQSATALDITQRGDEIKFIYFNGGARTGAESFLADDIERGRYETRIERAYAKVHWRKDELIIATRHVLDSLGYQAYTETDSWLLSEDRQTLTAKLSDGTVLVYEKEAADASPAIAIDPLEGMTPFRAVGVITGTGPCHGTSFEGTLKGETIGKGKIVFCGPPPQNWGSKPGSCGTEHGTLTFSTDGGGSSFRMNVIGQFCISESGGTFRGSYEVDRISIAGGFLGRIKGGSGTVEFSDSSNTVILYGVLLHD
jgi:hypothetical protein